MFDIITDIHGCINEFNALLQKLGQPRSDRQLLILGDNNDRGPDSVAVLDRVMQLENKQCVIGNHDDKMLRYLKGNKVTPSHGLNKTIEQLRKTSKEFRNKLLDFLNSLPFQLILDNGKLHVSHAGLPQHLQGKTNNLARSHALYGDTDGTKDENGYPIRKDWTKDYKGSTIVVHGHVPVEEVDHRNNVWNIDTSCCFGGKLTALRYPEMEIVQVPAEKAYDVRPSKKVDEK